MACHILSDLKRILQVSLAQHSAHSCPNYTHRGTPPVAPQGRPAAGRALRCLPPRSRLLTLVASPPPSQAAARPPGAASDGGDERLPAAGGHVSFALLHRDVLEALHLQERRWHLAQDTAAIRHRILLSIPRHLLELSLHLQHNHEGHLHLVVRGGGVRDEVRRAAQGHLLAGGRRLPHRLPGCSGRADGRRLQPGPRVTLRDVLGLLHLPRGGGHSAAALHAAEAGRRGVADGRAPTRHAAPRSATQRTPRSRARAPPLLRPASAAPRATLRGERAASAARPPSPLVAGHYILLLGLYRLFYILNWIYRCPLTLPTSPPLPAATPASSRADLAWPRAASGSAAPASPHPAPCVWWCHRSYATEPHYMQLIVWISGTVQTASRTRPSPPTPARSIPSLPSPTHPSPRRLSPTHPWPSPPLSSPPRAAPDPRGPVPHTAARRAQALYLDFFYTYMKSKRERGIDAPIEIDSV